MRKTFFTLTVLFYAFVCYPQSATLLGLGSSGGQGAGTIFHINEDGSGFGTFSLPVQNIGVNPRGLTQIGGKLYGMTTLGSTFGNGILFAYDTASHTDSVLLNFSNTSTGANPMGSLLMAPNGFLYGMTPKGGQYNYGVIFKFNPVSGTFIKILDFDSTTKGSHPQGSLMLANNNYLYGMTFDGGANGSGVLFSLDPSDSYSKLADFNSSIGSFPTGNLIQAIDSNLYGLAGTIIKYKISTNTLTKIYDFVDSTGSGPAGSLVEAANGTLYGTTDYGGLNYTGVIFCYNFSSGNYADIFDFDMNTRNSPGEGGLVKASNGDLYGSVLGGGPNYTGFIFKVNSSSNLCSIVNNNGTQGKLVWVNGKIFVNIIDSYFLGGYIYQFNPADSSLTTVFTFGGGTEGAQPFIGLVKAANGNIYGVDFYGGTHGYGALFKYDLNTNNYTKLYDFDSSAPYPRNLAPAQNGKIYLLSQGGGTVPYGAILEYDPSLNTVSNLHAFDSIHGDIPVFLMESGGNLYGTTNFGGTFGYGNLYKYNIAANSFSALYDFNDTTGFGVYPRGLNMASSGNLYGVTVLGGALHNGNLFEFNLGNNTYTDLVDFDGALLGGEPHLAPVEVNGKLYGLSKDGGINGDGVIYEYDLSSHIFNTVFDFNSLSGGGATGSLFLASDNSLYGLTSNGGDYNYGTIFRFTPGYGVSGLKSLSFLDGQPSLYCTLLEINLYTGIIDRPNMLTNLFVYPNPVSVTANFEYTLEKEREVSICLTDIDGRTVKTFVQNSLRPAGKNVEHLHFTDDIAAGQYSISITAGGQITLVKMVKIK